MKPFGLESILKYRRQIEDLGKQKLFKLLEEEADIQLQVKNKKLEIKNLHIELQDIQEQGATIDMLRLYENRIHHIHNESKKLHQSQEKLKTKISQQRNKLIKASQDVKIMDKLKQQQNSAYKKHLDKLEAAMLDEIAVLSYNKP